MDEAGNAFQRSLLGIWSSVVDRLPYVLAGILVFALFLLITRVVIGFIHRVSGRAGVAPNLRELFSRIASFVLTILGAFVAATVIFPAFHPGDLIAGLGITTVAIGFAFKDILQNFFAGILILWRQPFREGDEIKSGEFEGVVEEINSRSTWIRTYDGERAVIPNGDIYTQPVLVRTAHTMRRVRFKVGIGYADSVTQAREIILRTLGATEGVAADPGPWVYVTELAPSAVEFTVFFWTAGAPANVLLVRDRAIEAVKLALDEAGIDIPYPHQVNLEAPPERYGALGSGES